MNRPRAHDSSPDRPSVWLHLTADEVNRLAVGDLPWGVVLAAQGQTEEAFRAMLAANAAKPTKKKTA